MMIMSDDDVIGHVCEWVCDDDGDDDGGDVCAIVMMMGVCV